MDNRTDNVDKELQKILELSAEIAGERVPYKNDTEYMDNNNDVLNVTYDNKDDYKPLTIEEQCLVNRELARLCKQSFQDQKQQPETLEHRKIRLARKKKRQQKRKSNR